MAEFRFPQFIPDPNDPPSVGKKIAAAIPDVLAQPVIKGAQFWNGFMGGQTAIPNTPVYDATVLAPQGVTAPVAPGVTQKLGAAVGDVLSLPFSGLQALGNYIDPREVAPVKSITPRMDAIQAMPGYESASAPKAAKVPSAAVAALPVMSAEGIAGSRAGALNAVFNPALTEGASGSTAAKGGKRLRSDLTVAETLEAAKMMTTKPTTIAEKSGADLYNIYTAQYLAAQKSGKVDDMKAALLGLAGLRTPQVMTNQALIGLPGFEP